MSFSGVKGQEQAIKFLQAAIKSGRLPHAYIFAGPDGCGRSLLAKNFAKAVNCENTDNAPCGSCLSCRKIDNDLHPDVKWIRKDEKSRQIKIDQIRELERDIILKPYEARYKVYIIVEAELMNSEAANSFLKTLEEPPDKSLIVLIVERPKDLPMTIVSRCQLIRLNPMNPRELASILVRDYGVPEYKAELLSRISEGRLGKAISYESDMLEWKNGVLDEFAGDDRIEDYSSENRGELSKKLSVLVSWYRDLLVFKATGDESLVFNIDRLDDIKNEARRYSEKRVISIFESVLDAKENVENNINPKLALAVMYKDIR